MSNPVLISPSILSADFLHLQDALSQAEAAGADWVHIDVMDGHFVPNLTMGPFIVEACRRATRLPLDVHLMIENPDRLIPAFIEAGADYLTVHVETCPHPHRTLESIRDGGVRAGISLNPATPAASIGEVLPMLDLILVMSVNPGYSGQRFIGTSVPKIEQIRKALDAVGSAARLQVDGGITPETAPAVVRAGADVLVAASAVFGHPEGIAAGLKALRRSIA
jgi:ribulose-phosphate 3-epimerase